MKHGTPGTVSHGTLKAEHLVDSFADTLADLVQTNAEAWCSDEGRAARDRYLALVNEARRVLEDWRESWGEHDDGDDDDRLEGVRDALTSALEEFAAPYFYFGAHEGDGSDFGFWMSRDAMDEAVYDGDALSVSDLADVPDSYSGDVFVTSDHGNVSLYTVTARIVTEQWSIV